MQGQRKNSLWAKLNTAGILLLLLLVLLFGLRGWENTPYHEPNSVFVGACLTTGILGREPCKLQPVRFREGMSVREAIYDRKLDYPSTLDHIKVYRWRYWSLERAYKIPAIYVGSSLYKRLPDENAGLVIKNFLEHHNVWYRDKTFPSYPCFDRVQYEGEPIDWKLHVGDIIVVPPDYGGF